MDESQNLSLNSNIGIMSIPSAEEARSWNSNNLMMQLVGHNGQELEILDLSWRVNADVVTYHTAYPGKTVTNLKTKPRLQVNVYGFNGATTVIFEQKLYEGTEGTSSAAHTFNVNGGAAFIYITAYIGGEFSYKSGTTTYSATRWWNSPGYVSS